MKKLFEELNDGYIEVGSKEVKRDSRKKIISEDFFAKQRLKFKYKTIRERDFNFYGTWDNKLDTKIFTYATNKPGRDTIIRLNNELYDIIRVDYTENRRHMYWYLSKRTDGDG